MVDNKENYLGHFTTQEVNAIANVEDSFYNSKHRAIKSAIIEGKLL